MSLLRRGMILLDVLDKDDFAAFRTELVRHWPAVNGVLPVFLQKIALAYTDDPSPDLENSLQAVLDRGGSALIQHAVPILMTCKFAPLTRSLLHHIINYYAELTVEMHEIVTRDLIVAAERELVTELHAEELEVPERTDSAIDTRLFHWLMYIDAVESSAKMANLLNLRSYRSSSECLTLRLVSVCPLSPIVVSQDLQPLVFSPQFIFSNLTTQLVRYMLRLTANNVMAEERKSASFGDLPIGKNYPLIAKSFPFLLAAARQPGIHADLSSAHMLLASMVPYITAFELGERRMEAVNNWTDYLFSIPEHVQPLLIKMMIRSIKDNPVSAVGCEAQILSFLVDLYRRRLFGAETSASYSAVLGDLWGVLSDLSYEDPAEAAGFYHSLALLAHIQGRRRHRPGLLVWVHKHVLTRIKIQLINYGELRRLRKMHADEELPISNQNTPFIMNMAESSQPRVQLTLEAVNTALKVVKEAISQSNE